MTTSAYEFDLRIRGSVKAASREQAELIVRAGVVVNLTIYDGMEDYLLTTRSQIEDLHALGRRSDDNTRG